MVSSFPLPDGFFQGVLRGQGRGKGTFPRAEDFFSATIQHCVSSFRNFAGQASRIKSQSFLMAQPDGFDHEFG